MGALVALYAGTSPRRATFFSLSRQRKEGKRKATPLAASPPLRAGATCGARGRGAVAELTARLRRSVQTAATSQSTKRLRPAAQPRTPPAALLGASRGSWENTGHRCARPRHLSEVGAERSDGPDGLPRPSARAEKRRAWGGRWQRSMPPLRALTCCGCPSGAPQAQSEFRSTAPGPSIAGCPSAQRWGHGMWGRLSFAFFSLARQRKEGRPPGRRPGIQRTHSARPQPSAQPAPPEPKALK